MPLPEEIKDWITINGAHIPVDNEGEPQGEAGRKIAGSKARKDPPDTANVRGSGGLCFRKTLEEYVAEAGGDHYAGAKAFFRNELQGKSVRCHTDSGEQEARFTSNTWGELQKNMKSYPLKAGLIPLVPDIVKTGEYAKRPLYKDRTDHALAFHEYSKEVQTSEGRRRVIVDVREQPANNGGFSVYSMTGEGLPGYETRESFNKKRSPSGSMSGRSRALPEELLSEDSIAPILEVVNIRFEGELSPADEGAESMNQQRRARDALALDSSASKRHTDENGYLHVAASHITKAQVAPYRGCEIPGWEERGLNPNGIYYAYRDPVELEKSLPTWNGVPLHIEQHEDSADNPQRLTRVGTMGTSAVWKPPYIDNALVVWDAEAIAAIEDGSYKELSCAYRYEPDFTPGEAGGVPYDFVMRDIRANHVALVAEGRAGKDVVVADSASVISDILAQKESADMEENKNPFGLDEETKQAMVDCGLDANNEELAKAFVAGAGFAKQPEEGAGEGEATAENDAAPEPLAEPAAEPVAEPASQDAGEDIIQSVLEELAGLEEEKRLKIKALLAKLKSGAPAAANGDPAEDTSEAPEAKCVAADSAEALKRQIAADMTKDFRAKVAAARAVRPVCGDLDPMAFDSAAAIYGAALKTAGFNVSKYPASAWPAMFDASRAPFLRKYLQERRQMSIFRAFDGVFCACVIHFRSVTITPMLFSM